MNNEPWFWISTLLARTDLVRMIGGFNCNISFCEDRDLYFGLSLETPFAYLNKPLAHSDRNATPPARAAALGKCG